MRILITGNMGYVGSVLVPHLRHAFPDAELIGCDAGWFANCVTSPGRAPETYLNRQLFHDVRDLIPDNKIEIGAFDAVVYLAAVSNDAVGNKFTDVTYKVNKNAAARVALSAIKCGVKHFVFASSCSVYGPASDEIKTEESDPNPLTAYAESKADAEEILNCLDIRMKITNLRFATACGPSQRLRTDLTLNWMVACATLDGKVTVHGNGEQYRPLVDVRDMARAVEWALTRDGDDAVTVNIGGHNLPVRDIGKIVAQTLDVPISFEPGEPDNRSYMVSFGKFKALAPNHQPQFSLQQTIADLAFSFTEKQVRLDTLNAHIAAGRLSEDLRWQ